MGADRTAAAALAAAVARAAAGAGPAVSAERLAVGSGRHAASLRFAEKVPFIAAHELNAMDWGDVDWPVAHAAAIAWHAVKAGEPLTVLSVEPALYVGTGITALNPT